MNQALDQAGLDSSYQAKARGWLNSISETLAFQNNYSFYNKTGAVTALVSGQSSYALPVDFQKIDSVYRSDVNGVLGAEIFVSSNEDFDMYTRGYSGDPTLAVVDYPSLMLKFNSTPSSTTGSYFRIRYYRKPTTLSLDSADDGVIPDFPDQTVLRENLIKWAYENLDDERYPQKEAQAERANQKYMRIVSQETDTGKMNLAPENYRRRRFR